MLCQEFFIFGAVMGVEPTFSKGERFQGGDPIVSQPSYKEVVRSTSPPSVPLLYHSLKGLSRGFLHFLIFFSKAPTPVLHSQWQVIICGYFLPLTLSIISDFLKKSIPFSKKFLKRFFRRCSSKNVSL